MLKLLCWNKTNEKNIIKDQLWIIVFYKDNHSWHIKIHLSWYIKAETKSPPDIV